MVNSVIYVTGANGYLGSNIVSYLKQFSNLKVLSGFRTLNNIQQEKDYLFKCDLNAVNDLNFNKNSTIVHVAGLAHNRSACSSELFKVNTDGTINLATQAAKCGISRFIYISTVGVHGRYSETPITKKKISPEMDEYSNSKLSAELGLSEICHDNDIDLFILRPSLIFDVGAPGNVEKIKNMISIGCPLPISALNNIRQFCSLTKILRVVKKCCIVQKTNRLDHIFLVADSEPITVKEFFEIIARKNNMILRSFYFPKSLLNIILHIFRKKEIYQSLCKDFLIDTRDVDSFLKD